MTQKVICIDYCDQLKNCEDEHEIHVLLLAAGALWEAVGGTVDIFWRPNKRVAHLKVNGVSPEIVDLVHETAAQAPDISYVTVNKPAHIQAMKEELIECIGGPDISDAEVEALYEILAGNKGGT